MANENGNGRCRAILETNKMASGGYPYTLVGFMEEVDRRPLFFIEPLPATHVCSACGLVPSVKAFLPCGHFLCKPCYEQCERSGGIACPLDGDIGPSKEVAWIKHPARSILEKQIFCWNRTNGCNVVTTAAEICKHFNHQCGYHLAKCPQCPVKVLTTDVCAHLQSHCDDPRPSSEAAVQPGLSVSQRPDDFTITRSESLISSAQGIPNTNSMAVSTIQAQLKEISDALKNLAPLTTSYDGETEQRCLEARHLQEGLSQMRSQMIELKDQLDEFMHNVHANQQTFHNSFVEKNEALKQSLNDAAQPVIDHSALAPQFAAFREAMEDRRLETKAELERISIAIAHQYDRISELLRPTDALAVRPSEQSIEGTEAHAETLALNAGKIAWAKSGLSEDTREVLARFPSVMSVASTHTWVFEQYGILLETASYAGDAFGGTNPVYLRGYCVSIGIELGRSGSLRLYFRISKGKIDHFLEWPFNLKMKFSILHPQGHKKVEYSRTPSITKYVTYFSRPVQDHNDFVPVCYIPDGQAQLETCIHEGIVLIGLTLEFQDNQAQ